MEERGNKAKEKNKKDSVIVLSQVTQNI